jgi:hypothetical protein
MRRGKPKAIFKGQVKNENSILGRESQVSNNGFHVGALYNGMVFDNVTLAFPLSTWIANFMAISKGQVKNENFKTYLVNYG